MQCNVSTSLFSKAVCQDPDILHGHCPINRPTFVDKSGLLRGLLFLWDQMVLFQSLGTCKLYHNINSTKLISNR